MKITAILGCEVHKSLRKFQIQDLQHFPLSVDCVTDTLHPWSSRISPREPARSDLHAYKVAEPGQKVSVAVTLVTVRKLLELGYEVVVEKGSRESASFHDAE
jgi:hypothetical protein